MEVIRSAALYICSVLFILTEVSSEYVYIPSLVHHGIEGKPLLLSVEVHFPLDEVDLQGTWSHTRPSGSRTTLVTFTKENTITDMMYRSRLLFRQPNVSLLIRKLNQDDEGDYHLSLNIQFHNKTGLVMKEERTVRVTVDVPVTAPVIEKTPSHAVVEDKANVTLMCSVERGTRVTFHWLRNGVLLGPGGRYHFSQDNATLVIVPVRKEDMGTYRCVASNPVSVGRSSRTVDLNVYCEYARLPLIHPSIGPVSAQYRPSISLVSAQYQPSICLVSAQYPPSIHPVSAQYRPSISLSFGIELAQYQPSIRLVSAQYRRVSA